MRALLSTASLTLPSTQLTLAEASWGGALLHNQFMLSVVLLIDVRIFITSSSDIR
jgi:hypothetical protein